MENNLPEGWALVGLETCCDILDNLRIPVNGDERNKRGGNIPYYGATGQVGFIDDFLFDEELVLLGEDGAPFFDKSKKVAYRITGKSWVNNHAHVLRAKAEITNNKFLEYYLCDFDYTGYVNGTTRLKLTQGNLRTIPIKIPPPSEQHRIVAKLDALMERVERNKQRLDKIPALLKRFRQSVLAAAVSGRLTEGWRRENPDVPNPIQTLEEIKAWRLKNVKSESKRQAILQIFGTIEAGDRFEIPDNWKFVNLNKICDSFSYGTSQKSDNEGKVPVLRMGNLQNGNIDWRDLKYSSDKEEIRKYSLKTGDVLFNRTNSPELVGKTAIYLGDRPAIYAGYLIKINNLPQLNSHYLNYCLNSIYARDWCSEVKTDGVSQSNINAQKLGEFELPFCSPGEQQEIVRRVEQLFAFADKIEARYVKAKVMLDRLPQSILAKAFRGELVPQDPEDEPAGVLLERVRAEKEAAVEKKKKR